MTTRLTPNEQRPDVGALLAESSTAALLARGAPIFVAGGNPAVALWANDAALALFGATDLAGLTDRIFAGTDPGSKRLLELARAVQAGPRQRLERLRFFIGRQSETLTVQWRQTAVDEPWFALAVLDARPALLRAPAGKPAGATTLPVAVAQPGADGADAAQPATAALVEPVEGPRESIVRTAARLDADAVRADLLARFDGARSVRFLWQTDADLLLVSITGALCEVVGCAISDIVGRSFAEVASQLGLDAQKALASVLGRRETWSGIEVLWPVAGADAAVPVTLGALPAFDRDRRFEGFRGFGVIHVQRVVTQEAAPAAPIETDASLIGLASAEQNAEAPTTQATDAELMAQPVAETSVAAEPAPAAEKGIEQAQGLAPIAAETGEVELLAEEPPSAGEPPPGPEPDRSHGQNVVALRAYQAIGRISAPPGPRLVERETSPSPDLSLPTAERAELSPVPGGASSGSPKPSLSERLSEVILTPHVREGTELSNSEQLAFREIARALGARIKEAPSTVIAEPPPVADVAAPIDNEPGLPAVLDRLGVGILVSRDGEALFANRRLLDRLGYASSAALAAAGTVRSLVLRPGAEAIACALRAAGGDSVLFEGLTQTIDWQGASARLTTLQAQAVPDLAGRVGVLEQEVRQRDTETRELHAILDTATDGVVVLDESGSIVSLNRSGQALFGFEQNEVAGEPFSLLLAKESHAAATDYFNGLKANGVASVLNDGREVVGRARQGGAIPLFMTMGRVGIAQNGKFCAVLRDITAWKKAERELNEARRQAERASALKSDFLAKISHEIRTPLNAILGFAEVIMEERFGPVGNDRYKDYLKDIHSSGTHVMSLVNDLLDLSKIEAGKLELNFGAVDANKIVSECVSLIQPQANQERVIVRLSVAPQLPSVVADERSLRQIVLNILSNAVKFNVAGGQVIVSTALTDAGNAVIRVRDTGIGMSESDLETALEPFRQIQTSRNTSGTGLGLPLTKALVEANRASFTIKSRKKEGTLVEVAFPSARVLAG